MRVSWKSLLECNLESAERNKDGVDRSDRRRTLNGVTAPCPDLSDTAF